MGWLGPLVPFGGAYRLELSARGCTPRSIVPQLRQVARLSRWLQGEGLTAERLDERQVEEFLAAQRAEGRYPAQWSRPGLLCLLAVLREQGVVGVCVPAPAGSDTEVLLACFARHLLEERGLATGTVRGYVAHARLFLTGLPGEELSAAAAKEVSAAVLRVVGHGWSVSAAQNFVAGLRVFLRYCFMEGLLGSDLSGAALAVTGRRR